MAITTQLTLSIYTAVRGEERAQPLAPRETATARSEKTPPPITTRLPIDPAILTATPVVRPVKLHIK